MAHIFKLHTAHASDIGRKRANNEDTVGVFEPGDEQTLRLSGALYIVADGVGGAAYGERASKYAVQKVLFEYYRRADVPPAERLAQIIRETGNEIYAYGHGEEGGGRPMATTIVAAAVWRERLIVANVGDSRAYLLRAGQAEQITVDHNLVGEMVHEGLMTPEEARQSKVKNRLTRSLGGRPNPKVDIFTRTLQTGDRIVLCSDGLTRYASDADIVRLAGEAPPEEAVRRLIDFANEQGGADNISAVVIAVGEAVPMGAWTSTGTPTRIAAPQTLRAMENAAAPLAAATEPAPGAVAPDVAFSAAQTTPPSGTAALLKRWWWLAAAMILVGCGMGGALWWGLHRRVAPVSTPTLFPAAASLPASPTPAPPAAAPTPTPPPTLSPTPVPTFSPTAAAVAPAASSTWTPLPPGQYACLGTVLPGGSFYGLLTDFGLLSTASDMEFWQNWARQGRFPEIYLAAETALPPGALDYRIFEKVNVPREAGPGSAGWQAFLDRLNRLQAGTVILLPGVGREQCVTRGGAWRQFAALPPWMRPSPTLTPAASAITPTPSQ